jgi:hypothetical protein
LLLSSKNLPCVTAGLLISGRLGEWFRAAMKGGA